MFKAVYMESYNVKNLYN